MIHKVLIWHVALDCLIKYLLSACHHDSFNIEGSISFERETYTVGEDDGYVEVCIVSFNLTDTIEVEFVSPDTKAVDNPAFGRNDSQLQYMYKFA